jgi:hypothetical protein
MPVSAYLGRPAWKLESKELRVSILQCGGHIGEITLKSGNEVNPLWVPPIPTIDSDQYDPAIHGTIYGTNAEARLLSGLVGHNLCFPYWGDPSEAEAAAGMTFHGETNIRRWSLLEETPERLSLEVHLLESTLTFRRNMSLKGSVIHVESIATNDSSWDRPFGWCEHVTFGPPFLQSDVTRFDASAGKGFVTGHPEEKSFDWPTGKLGAQADIAFDLHTFDPIRHSDLVNSYLLQHEGPWGWFTAFHRRYSLLIGYLFRREHYPWLNVWENNDQHRVTRGMEFSNTPHHGTMKALIKSAEMWGARTYEWLDAKSTVKKNFTAFVLHIPADFGGTQDIQVSSREIEIFEAGSGRKFQVAI